MKLSISLTKKEVLLGWLFLICQLSVLPAALVIGNGLLPVSLDLSALNFVMFVINFCLCFAVFHRFLIASAKRAAFSPLRCLFYGALALGIYYIAGFLIGLFIGFVNPDFANANDASIQSMAEENYSLIAFGTVFLVPIAEECLYRGLLFCGFHRKSRILAYLLSTLVFALIHVSGYIGVVSWPVLALSLLQYLPAGLSLAWAYEKTDTIWTPILMHMTINLLSISSLR